MPRQVLSHFLNARLRSFRYAFAGLFHLLRTQRNAQIHAIATIFVALAASLCKLSAPEWCWLIAATGAVWTAEALNTAIESLCDALHPGRHPAIGKTKDLAAAAVLVTAATAAAIALAIFLPHF